MKLLKNKTNYSNHPGKVYLAGAGPGDPELLTMKVHRLLQQVDIVYYDLLVSPAIIAMAGANVEKVCVGKLDGFHSVEQEEINRRLVVSAREGKQVLRLKGGDPFVFGRGAEEAMDLVEAGIQFEIVPGISSSIAAPAYAGIPVTHRNLAMSFAVVTGHLCADNKATLDYSKFAVLDTVIFLMGVKRRHAIAQALIDGGKPASEPVAFIERGSTSSQKLIMSNLGEIAQGKVEVKSPAVMVVGRVTELSQQLQWFHPGEESASELSPQDRALINELQKNFPLEAKPFAALAERMRVDEESILTQVQQLKEEGKVSRVGPLIKPNSIGRSELVAVSVPPDRIEEVAAFINSLLEVNHNYEREHHYNLWFVVTAADEERIRHVVSLIEERFALEALRLPMEESFHIDLGFAL